MVSFNKPEAMAYYKRCRQIEPFLEGGFNIEDTHVTDLEKLEKLSSLTIIAFIPDYAIGH